MKNNTNKLAWFVFAFLAIAVGLYPLLYLFLDPQFGLLASKSDALLANFFWKTAFNGHIYLGGLALTIGWVQFSKKIRKANLKVHRAIGKLYVIAVLISGTCGVFIAFNANGGIISTIGFASLGIIWLYVTIKAYLAVRKGDMQLHQGLMVYSYAACFAAVMLRVWLPVLAIVFSDFIVAYRIVSWICWVPNMIFAFLWVRRKGLILV